MGGPTAPGRGPARLRGASLGLLVLALAGCLRGDVSRRPPIHLNPNMDDQPRYDPQAASSFFYDGAAMRPRVPGTLARGELGDEAFTTGKTFWGYVENPLPIDDALLARGRERFGIYCTPCHGARGDGHGMLYERAGVEAADLRSDRVRGLSDGRLFEIITDGKGLMSGYRYPIPPRDRWAIVAWIRRLPPAAPEASRP